MDTVGFLHTSPVHVPVFEALVADMDPSVRVVAVVEPPLLEWAQRHGVEHPDVISGVERAIRELKAAGAQRVVCTCSTIGGVAETLGTRSGVDLTRVDRAMAERAVAAGSRIVVLATAESTIGPTRDLLESVAAASGVASDIDTRLVAGAWERFEVGDLAGYHALVADAIERSGDDVSVIVLAQASMAPAADLVEGGTEVLSSPRLAVERLLGAPQADSEQ